MREVHQYIADDGTIFDNEYDCTEYERDKRVARLEIEMFNAKYKPLPLTSKSFEECVYLAIYNEDDCKEVTAISSEMGIESPFNSWRELPMQAGLYWYDGSSCGWHSWEQELNKLTEMKMSLGLE